jgi:hypothetical protein
MNIHPKYSHADQLGVAGLLAFLADIDACAARFQELKDEAARVEDVFAAASQRVTLAEDAEKAAVAAQAEAAMAVDKAQAKMTAALGAQARADTNKAEAGALAVKVEEERLRLAGVQKAIDERSAQLDAREEFLVQAETAASSLKAEYEGKIETLSALIEK